MPNFDQEYFHQSNDIVGVKRIRRQKKKTFKDLLSKKILPFVNRLPWYLWSHATFEFLQNIVYMYSHRNHRGVYSSRNCNSYSTVEFLLIRHQLLLLSTLEIIHTEISRCSSFRFGIILGDSSGNNMSKNLKAT